MSTTLYHNIMNPFLSTSSKIFVFLRRCVWLREIMRIQQKKYEKKKLFGKAIYFGAEKPSIQFLCTHYFGVLRPNRLCSSQYIIILIWDKIEFLLGIYIIGKHHTTRGARATNTRVWINSITDRDIFKVFLVKILKATT